LDAGFVRAFSLLRSLSPGRFINLIQAEGSRVLSGITGRAIVAGLPWAASVEPTTSCNLRCTECPTGQHSLTRAGGSLNPDGFKRLLDRLSPNLFYLTFYFQGEPLMNAALPEMIRIARKRNIFVATSTNAHYLDESMAAKLVDSGLNHLIISLDGLDQKTYATYRVGGNVEAVKNGITHLVEARRKAGRQTPFIELQFIVMRHNEHQLEEVRAFARQTGVDQLSLKSAQVYSPVPDPGSDRDPLIPRNLKYSRYRQLPNGEWVPKQKLRNRCVRLWRSVVVTWDGITVPCCYDKDAGHRTGDLSNLPLTAIWKNESYTAFRKQLLRDRTAVKICRECGE
jgi:MoaA/NifB/PqqE/SkfB family radical SAM enzyme